MVYTDACIYFIIAILSIAFPLVLQTIGRLDERYKSNLITKLFQQEQSWRYFRSILPFSLIAVLCNVVANLSILKDICFISWIIGITGVLLLSTGIALIANFLLFIDKILIYYTPAKLILHLQVQKDTDDQIYFRAMADILYLSLKEMEEDHLSTLNKYFHLRFSGYRKDNQGKPIQYPVSYYEMVHKTIREVIPIKSSKIALISHRAASGLWLLGSFEENEIHEDTYTWIWRNCVLMVENERNDLIMNYWESADQYFSVSLQGVPIMWGTQEGQPIAINKAQVDKRELERDRFWEFHLALGGLLLYCGRYDCIRRMFIFTTSIPPRYNLLPDSIKPILAYYLRFLDPYDQNFPFIRSKYWLPGTEGVEADREVKSWICRYIATLLIRQYAITSYYYGVEPLRLPQVPQTQAARKFELENIEPLIAYVNELLANREALRIMKLDFVTEEWAAENHKPHPIALLAQYRTNLKEAFEAAEISQDLSPHKVAAFKESSSEILIPFLNGYGNINNAYPINGEYEDHHINGANQLMDKSPFADEQGVDHLNFHSVFASMLTMEIKFKVSRSLLSRTRQRYLLKQEHFFKGLDQLQLKPNEYVLLNFGVDIQFLNREIQNSDITNDQYKGIPIITIDSEYFDYSILHQCIIAIKRSDLPNIMHMDIAQEIINKFGLEVYNEPNHLYGSVINLHEETTLNKELTEGNSGKNIDKSVLLCLQFHMLIRWKKATSAILVGLYDQFYQQGLANNPDEIDPIK